jgi:hypothetical protein
VPRTATWTGRVRSTLGVNDVCLNTLGATDTCLNRMTSHACWSPAPRATTFDGARASASAPWGAASTRACERRRPQAVSD